MKTTAFLRHFPLLAGSALLAVSPAFAVTWDGSDDGLWSTAGNWDVAPANGNSLTFTGPGNKTNTNGAGITSINLLTLSNSGWDIDLGGSAVTINNVTVTGGSDLTGDVIMTNGSPRTFTLNGSNTTLTLDGVLTLARPNAAMTLSVNGAGNTLELGGLSLTGGNANRTIDGSGNITVNGSVTDSINGNFTMAGAGILTLAGASNSYDANTIVSAGTLYVTGALANSAVTVQANGTVGSDGTTTGSLNNGMTIDAGGNLDLNGATLGANSTGILGITGGSLTLGALTFEDLVGWDWLNADVGTYELIDGSFSIDWGGTAYTSEGSAYDFGNGKKGYFTSGSLNAVIVAIPEPKALILGALGALLLIRRRR